MGCLILFDMLKWDIQYNIHAMGKKNHDNQLEASPLMRFSCPKTTHELKWQVIIDPVDFNA